MRANRSAWSPVALSTGLPARGRLLHQNNEHGLRRVTEKAQPLTVVSRLRTVKFIAAAVAVLIALATPAAASSPGGFLPSSISWLDARQGMVFGYAPCGEDLCPRLMATADGGDTWHQLNEPPVKLPDNHNQVKLTVTDAKNAFVTDGTTLWATNDATGTWYPVNLAGLVAPYFIGKIVVAHDKVYAVASSLGNDTGNATRIYSAPIGAPTLHVIPGFTVTGGYTYGDIAADGDVLQFYLGADYATGQYGYSVDGVHVVAAPSPCPTENPTELGGIRDGRPIALCNGSGGSPGPGSMTKQVFTAAELGGTYVASNPAPALGITEGFGPATPDIQTIAAVGGSISLLHSTFDAGKSWTTTRLSERGFGVFDLHFVTDEIGYLVDGVPDATDGSAVYRSTDSGHTWQQIDFQRSP
jgi:hypothetical protein